MTTIDELMDTIREHTEGGDEAVVSLAFKRGSYVKHWGTVTLDAEEQGVPPPGTIYVGAGSERVGKPVRPGETVEIGGVGIKNNAPAVTREQSVDKTAYTLKESYHTGAAVKIPSDDKPTPADGALPPDVVRQIVKDHYNNACPYTHTECHAAVGRSLPSPAWCKDNCEAYMDATPAVTPDEGADWDAIMELAADTSDGWNGGTGQALARALLELRAVAKGNDERLTLMVKAFDGATAGYNNRLAKMDDRIDFTVRNCVTKGDRLTLVTENGYECVMTVREVG